MTAPTTKPASDAVHVFERAGLGTAPFRLVDVEVRKYQACPGAPVQPGASCDYCGTAIMECCIIGDANGRRFVVGNECVRKTGDAGLRRQINKANTNARHESEDARIAAGVAFCEANRARMESIEVGPVAVGYGKPRTLAARFDWMMRNAGRSGKLRAITEVRKALGGSHA